MTCNCNFSQDQLCIPSLYPAHELIIVFKSTRRNNYKGFEGSRQTCLTKSPVRWPLCKPVVAVWRKERAWRDRVVPDVQSFPDETRLASGSVGKTDRLRRCCGRKMLQTLQGYNEGINQVVRSPDGDWIASYSLVRSCGCEMCRAVPRFENGASRTMIFRRSLGRPIVSCLPSDSNDPTIVVCDSASMGALPCSGDAEVGSAMLH